MILSNSRLNHIFQMTYLSDQSHDPEGMLGSLTSVFLCFLGLQVCVWMSLLYVISVVSVMNVVYRYVLLCSTCIVVVCPIIPRNKLFHAIIILALSRPVSHEWSHCFKFCTYNFKIYSWLDTHEVLWYTKSMYEINCIHGEMRLWVC